MLEVLKWSIGDSARRDAGLQTFARGCAARHEREDVMAKARKAKKVKRPGTKRKTKSGKQKKKKRLPKIGERISGVIQIVSGAMAETARMRRKMKRRTPMDEG